MMRYFSVTDKRTKKQGDSRSLILYRRMRMKREIRERENEKAKREIWSQNFKANKCEECPEPEPVQSSVSQKTLCNKQKSAPHHATGGYIERSYLEGGPQKTSLGGPY